MAALMGRATEELAARSGTGHRRAAGREVRQRGRADHRVLRAERRRARGRQGLDTGSIVGNICWCRPLDAVGGWNARSWFHRIGGEAQSLHVLLARLADDAGDLRARDWRLATSPTERNNVPHDLEVMSAFRGVLLTPTPPACLLAAHAPRPLQPDARHDGHGEPTPGRCARRWSRSRSPGVAVGVMSEILVGSSRRRPRARPRAVLRRVIVVAIVGNAAEHWVAVYFAPRTRWTCRSTSRSARRADRPLRRAGARAVLVLRRTVPDAAGVQRARAGGGVPGGPDRQPGHAEGESTWFEGVQLLAVYVVLALVFLFV